MLTNSVAQEVVRLHCGRDKPNSSETACRLPCCERPWTPSGRRGSGLLPRPPLRFFRARRRCSARVRIRYVPLERAVRGGAAGFEIPYGSVPEPQDTVAASRAYRHGATSVGLDLQGSLIRKLDDERREPVGQRVDPDLTAGSRQRNVEEATLFGERVRIRRRHRQMEKWIVLDPAGEALRPIGDVDEHHVVGFETLGGMNRSERDVQVTPAARGLLAPDTVLTVKLIVPGP